jgi:glucosamine--fructose-6-phosphate aminotransferase (isomerizing)
MTIGENCMCGIIGVIGYRKAVPLLLEGLRRMEYRGYDSAGIAVIEPSGMYVKKQAGKIAGLSEVLAGNHLEGTVGIGHTRWATHGIPSDINAHPHIDGLGQIAIIHNGIIENYLKIRQELEKQGHEFTSETDTETLAHLIGELYDGNLEKAVKEALRHIRGTYGLAIIASSEPDKIITARMGSPIIIGLGEGENFVASDMAAFVNYTRNVTYLNDGEIAVIKKDSVQHKTLGDRIVNKKVERILFNIEQIEKGGYAHFMLKEINEQPRTVEDAFRGRLLPEIGNVKFGGLQSKLDEIYAMKRMIIVACGTSWHAGVVGEYMIEEMSGIPVEVEYASEFRYRHPIIEDGTVVLAISQSGETADTLAAVKEAKQKAKLVLGLCNVVGSSIARETDAGVYLHAGPEIGVASTKAFTSQITILAMIALLLGRHRRISSEKGRLFIKELKAIPEKMQTILEQENQIKKLAPVFNVHHNALYLGRGVNFPVAMEGALKLKEISYVHAEGYPAAEMKHGPIALIEPGMPVVFIAIQDGTYEKILSNIEEVKARKGCVIAIANEGDTEIQQRVNHVITIPKTHDLLTPLLTAVPMQLLAYYVAVLKKCHIDQPRNLAKSVTVE